MCMPWQEVCTEDYNFWEKKRTMYIDWDLICSPTDQANYLNGKIYLDLYS